MTAKSAMPHFPLSIVTDLKRLAQGIPVPVIRHLPKTLLAAHGVKDPQASKDAPPRLVTALFTRHRTAQVVPPMVGHQIYIHNGKEYIPVPNPRATFTLCRW